MSDMIIYTEDGEYNLHNSELIEHLENDGYTIIGDGLHTVDYEGNKMLREIIQLFLVSDIFARENIYRKLFDKETEDIDFTLNKYNNYDIFNYLDYNSFDFLDNIDSQETVRHLEDCGYVVKDRWEE